MSCCWKLPPAGPLTRERAVGGGCRKAAWPGVPSSQLSFPICRQVLMAAPPSAHHAKTNWTICRWLTRLTPFAASVRPFKCSSGSARARQRTCWFLKDKDGSDGANPQLNARFQSCCSVWRTRSFFSSTAVHGCNTWSVFAVAGCCCGGGGGGGGGRGREGPGVRKYQRMMGNSK